MRSLTLGAFRYLATNPSYQQASLLLLSSWYSWLESRKRGPKNESSKKSIPPWYCTFDSAMFTEISRCSDKGSGKLVLNSWLDDPSTTWSSFLHPKEKARGLRYHWSQTNRPAFRLIINIAGLSYPTMVCFFCVILDELPYTWSKVFLIQTRLWTVWTQELYSSVFDHNNRARSMVNETKHWHGSPSGLYR